VTASCGAEYEWGVHVSVYAEKAGLSEAQIASLVSGGPEDDCWTDEAILELLMLAGTYRTVSYLVNGLRLPLELGARRFPAYAPAGKDTQCDTPRSVGRRS
jgi:hypothetical protein